MNQPAQPLPLSTPSGARDDPEPVAPTAPALEDCCRSGCTPCVFDLYEEAMDRYHARLHAWRARHPNASARP